MASCPVTFPNGSNYRWAFPRNVPISHGNGALWTDPGAGGKIVLRPDQVREDGSIAWKMGWYRGVRGKLQVTGRRLDASAPPAQGHYDSEGYGDSGFQAGWIYFPSEGCWEITGRVGDASLTFVSLVVKVPFEPRAPAWLPGQLHIKDRDVLDLPQSIRYIYGTPSWLDSEASWDGWIKGEVTWGDGELSIETTQGVRKDPVPYPEDAVQPVTVHGQPGVCMQGAEDEKGQWQGEADAGTLEWSDGDFSYRINHTRLGLSCEDLLQVAGPVPAPVP